MKKLLLLSILLFAGGIIAQTDGLNYQAVIIDPNVQQIPGENVTGNILPNTELGVRFTIFNAEGMTEYKEVQQTATNKFGMIELIIGQGNAETGAFNEIYWDGTPKNLLVEINLEGNYSELSRQELLFIPYAFHRNIKATGDLDAAEAVYFGQWLRVEGSTNLNSELSVNNESRTQLSGILTVEKAATLGGNLKVTNESFTNLTGTLSVGDRAQLKNTLDVVGSTTLHNRLLVANQKPSVLTGTLRVDGISNFNNTVNINNGSPLTVTGDLTVDSETTLNDDLTVHGDTNLNSSLSVNNGSPTDFTGTLNVGGQTVLQNTLLVDGETNLNSVLNVNNTSPTNLSGTLTVGLATNLNSSLNVNNGSPTHLTGTLNVTGDIVLQNDLTVDGFTNLNNTLQVNNGSPVALSGNLSVGGHTDLNDILNVDGNTTVNNALTVSNASSTELSGTLDIDGATVLNSSLDVLNGSSGSLNGTLTVDGTALLNNGLTVANGSSSLLTGSLDIDGETLLNDDWSILNSGNVVVTGLLGVDGTSTFNGPLYVNLGADTNLSGTLQADGASTLNNTLVVNGFTQMNSSLDVTGAALFNSLSSESITVQSDNTGFIAVFENINSANGDGLQIKLGRNHGAWTGGSYYNLPNVIANEFNGPLAVLKGRLENPGPNPFFTYSEIIQLAPTALKSGALINITNQVFNTVNTQLGLPIAFPDINMPGRLLSNEIEFFGGSNAQCSGQACFSICFPFAGCTTICVPPVNVCVPAIPRIAFPGINVPTIPINVGIPNKFNFVPALPMLPENGISNVSLPVIPTSVVSNSLTKENEYITFADKDGRVAGTIRAQSLQDFRDNTILDNVYVLNVLSSFVGIDLVDGVTAGVTSVTNLIDEFNDLGVEYSSGNGDYAEWLERWDHTDHLSAGDIVAVKGGKITRALSNAEQFMVVSRKPIVLGNVPQQELIPLGNSVAFRGQVPVKVIGPVNTGDYIIANSEILGYGLAVAPEAMTTNDFKFVVGRSWEENLQEGPKIVKAVIGVYNGDWNHRVKNIENRQKVLDKTIETFEEKLKRIEQKLNNSANENTYASKE